MRNKDGHTPAQEAFMMAVNYLQGSRQETYGHDQLETLRKRGSSPEFIEETKRHLHEMQGLIIKKYTASVLEPK